MIWDPLADLLVKLLNSLLPSKESKGCRDQKNLGRYLMRIASIVDAYVYDGGRLRESLEPQYRSRHPTTDRDLRFASSTRRLTSLTQEFGETLAEIDYLKLFDDRFHEALQTSYAFEMGMPWITRVGALSEVRHGRVTYDTAENKLRIISANRGQTPMFGGLHTTTFEYDLDDESDRKQLLKMVNEVMRSLDQSYSRIAQFVQEHFRPKDLFRMRKEMFHTRDQRK